MSFSVGKDVRCNKIRLEGIKAGNDYKGFTHQVLTADGTGKCVWANETGGIGNPMTRDLNQLTYNITGTGLVKNDGVELNNMPDDTLAPSSIYTGSLYKFKLKDGTLNQLPYQRLLNQFNAFPTRLSVNYVNGLPVFGFHNEAFSITNILYAGGTPLYPVMAQRDPVFGLYDDTRYDVCNTRAGIGTINYFNFGFNEGLPCCDGVWGVDKARGILKIEVFFDCDFVGVNNNEFSVYLERFDTTNRASGTATLLSATQIYNRKTDVKQLRDNITYYVKAFENDLVGMSYDVFCEVPASSSHDGGTTAINVKYTWIPVN